MSIKVAAATVLLILVGGANVPEKESTEPIHAASLGSELFDLERAYHQRAIDAQRYYARKEILLTAWELRLGDQYN